MQITCYFPVSEQWNASNWGEILFSIEYKIQVLPLNSSQRNLFAQVKHPGNTLEAEAMPIASVPVFISAYPL